MDASKLRNSCICGNTRPYLECCGRFADPVPASGDAGLAAKQSQAASTASASGQAAVAEAPSPSVGPEAEAALYYAFRHGLHELSMALFPLRALYQAYWEKLAKEDYPHDLLMEDPEYGRAIVENFFWDHFVQYSDARPILRTARELEGKDLRLAHDLMQWSFAPLWFYRVQERNERTARLINLGNLKPHVVFHGGRMPGPGEGVLTRILPFRGREFCGHTALAFSDGTIPADTATATRLDALFRAGCRELGVKASVTLRPDVHCEEWRRHGGVFLALWRAEIYDTAVGRPTRTPATASGSGPVFNLAIRNRDGLVAALSQAQDVRATGAGQWELRFRHLRLARMEAKGGNLLVTVTDPAFRAQARDWLRGRLGETVSPPEDGLVEPMPGESAEAQDLWVHTPMDMLNGQTPIQASTHDLGRRRLHLILKDMIRQGRDVTALRRQLGI